MTSVPPFHGILVIDDKLVDENARFPTRPTLGDMEWKARGWPFIVHVTKVETYLEGSEKRFRVFASTR